MRNQKRYGAIFFKVAIDKIMEDSSDCCGKDIKTCAKVIAIIGIVSSVLSFNILGIVIYVLVYIGVQKRRPGYLLPAKIILILGAICTIILLFAGITVGIVVVIKKPDLATPTSTPDSELSQKISSVYIVIYGILLLFGIVYLFISLIIIHKARNHLLLYPELPEFNRSFSLDEK